jgi:hypothetical protein
LEQYWNLNSRPCLALKSLLFETHVQFFFALVLFWIGCYVCAVGQPWLRIPNYAPGVGGITLHTSTPGLLVEMGVSLTFAGVGLKP